MNIAWSLCCSVMTRRCPARENSPLRWWRETARSFQIINEKQNETKISTYLMMAKGVNYRVFITGRESITLTWTGLIPMIRRARTWRDPTGGWGRASLLRRGEPKLPLLTPTSLTTKPTTHINTHGHSPRPPRVLPVCYSTGLHEWGDNSGVFMSAHLAVLSWGLQ